MKILFTLLLVCLIVATSTVASAWNHYWSPRHQFASVHDALSLCLAVLSVASLPAVSLLPPPSVAWVPVAPDHLPVIFDHGAPPLPSRAPPAFPHLSVA